MVILHGKRESEEKVKKTLAGRRKSLGKRKRNRNRKRSEGGVPLNDDQVELKGEKDGADFEDDIHEAPINDSRQIEAVHHLKGSDDQGR